MVEHIVITKTVSELSPVEYRACSLANYGLDEGFMLQVLREARFNPKEHPATVVMFWNPEEPDSTKGLIAWCMLTPVTLKGLLAVTAYTKRKSKYTAEFWVKKQYRRQGYGKLLMAEVKKFDPRPHVFPHDGPSGELFSAYEVTVLKWDLPNLRRGKPKVA